MRQPRERRPSAKRGRRSVERCEARSALSRAMPRYSNNSNHSYRYFTATGLSAASSQDAARRVHSAGGRRHLSRASQHSGRPGCARRAPLLSTRLPRAHRERIQRLLLHSGSGARILLTQQAINCSSDFSLSCEGATICLDRADQDFHVVGPLSANGLPLTHLARASQRGDAARGFCKKSQEISDVTKS